MCKQIVGLIFISISAFLYGVWHLSAASFGANMHTYSKENFAALLTYVGSGPKIFSIIALIIGVIYLIIGSVKEFESKKK